MLQAKELEAIYYKLLAMTDSVEKAMAQDWLLIICVFHAGARAISRTCSIRVARRVHGHSRELQAECY